MAFPRSERPFRERGGLASGLGLLLVALFAIGLVSRSLPIIEGGQRVLTQFPAEDGYLMLTIARNLAVGSGMSTAAGTIATNGTQPLATFLWAGALWLVDGDREIGVRLVLLLELLLATATALALAALGRHALAERPWGAAAAWLGAALWYASTVALPRSMNCQETVLYTLVTLAVLRAWLMLREEDGLRGAVLVGLLLGVAFWARNDAVYLAGAVGLAHLACGGSGGRERVWLRFGQSVAMGVTALLVALPWLVYNQLSFGSIVPISGPSQSIGFGLAHSLERLPAVLGQFVVVVVGVRTPHETRLVAQLAGGAAVLAGAIQYTFFWRVGSRRERKLLVVGGLLLLALTTYYGLFFGAPYHLKRYLYPVSPLFALGAAAAAVGGLVRMARTRPHTARVAAVSLAVLLAGITGAQNVQLFARGLQHGHWVKTQWVRENVEPDAWVGAIQSGMLGYFHDRTLNLDGKVNPQSLEARKQGRLAAYVIRSPIEWLVDWPLIRQLMRPEVMQRTFELAVDDPERKLVVYRRRPRPVESTP